MYPLRRDVETCGEAFTVVRVGSVPVPSTTDAVDLVLPLGGDRLTTKQLPVGDNAITVRWCYGLREMLPLARQMPELCVGSVSNLSSVVANGRVVLTGSQLGGSGHRAYERTTMAASETDGRWLREHPCVGRPRIAASASPDARRAAPMTTEQARMQAILDELPGPTPLSGEMVALLLPPARDDRKVFKLSAAMWKIVCIYIDASGGWAADSKSWAVFHAAIKYAETNFPENVPPGKLQAQTVMKHYHNCWTRPRVLDHGGRRAFIPPGAMIHVIAAVRGAMRYPLEMNSRLLRPVIKGTLMTVDGGIYRNLLADCGGRFKISSDWINKLCVKLRLPYKRCARARRGGERGSLLAQCSPLLTDHAICTRCCLAQRNDALRASSRGPRSPPRIVHAQDGSLPRGEQRP